MSGGIEQTLASYRKSLSERRERHAAFAGSLGKIVGSRIKVVGFPDSVLMTTHDPKTWQPVRRISVPVYKIVDFVGDPPREPSEVEETILDSANSKSITVSFIRNELELPKLHKSTGYRFSLNQIIYLQLISENASAQI